MGPRTDELSYWGFAGAWLFVALLLWLAGANLGSFVCAAIGVLSFVLRRVTVWLALRNRR